MQALDGTNSFEGQFLDCSSITIYKSSCMYTCTSLALQFINILLLPQAIDMASHILLVIASFLAIVCASAPASDPSPLQDFCVAHPPSSELMAYCSKVNASHFFSSELRVPGKTSNPIGFAVTIAQIPGLNTLGLALGRGDYAPGGTSTLHTHPRATEIATVLEGSLIAGFVASNPENRLVWKVLQKGDVFVFPIGVVHFKFNVGNGPAATMAAFTSQSPGFIRVGDLFATNPHPFLMIFWPRLSRWTNL
ncbi:hypothetical protein POTOM_060047 [Populus tomentosa]|uniref:Germin-like protein n=1 Tax=Populus tomentosa TaxID=118781 RepID=A0A8X7XRD5_POPTO|nr:hypothetical protein POTOM_060047 [Populus tomentosa]